MSFSVHFKFITSQLSLLLCTLKEHFVCVFLYCYSEPCCFVQPASVLFLDHRFLASVKEKSLIVLTRIYSVFRMFMNYKRHIIILLFVDDDCNKTRMCIFSQIVQSWYLVDYYQTGSRLLSNWVKEFPTLGTRQQWTPTVGSVIVFLLKQQSLLFQFGREVSCIT